MSDPAGGRAPEGQEAVLERADAGVTAYLERMAVEARRAGAFGEEYFEHATANVIGNLGAWYRDPDIDRLSPNLKAGVRDAIEAGDWENITNAYVRTVKFGTGGIRSLMAFDKASIERLARDGLDARILKGPNTINNIVVLQMASGVARYLIDTYGVDESGAARAKVVVGFDSRIRGSSFAELITELCLAEGLTVYLFDEPVPYPEVTFAIPDLGADIGIFISASHNDYRYNGFKLSGPNGAQLEPEVRDVILKQYIQKTRPADVRLLSLESAPQDALKRLHFLGGREPLRGQEGRDYYGREADLIDEHGRHIEQMEGFLLRKNDDGAMEGGADLNIVYAAFNGSGRRGVPRLLEDLGCRRVWSVSGLDPLDGFFPAFRSDPGMEQQPDPGDPRAAKVALAELEQDTRRRERGDAGYEDCIAWAEADILIGTDPDADRCGVVVKPPPAYADRLKKRPTLRAGPDHVLVYADDIWTLLLWYRLHMEIEREGRVVDADRKFIALSHTTTDMIARLARKHGLGVLKTWVGFAWLSNGVARAWTGESLPTISEGRASPADEKCNLVFYDTTGMAPGRTVNVATLEQSNGWSILGGPPEDPKRMLGEGGHVRDKDGTFAALLVTEVAAYAKATGTDLLSLLAEHVYADPDVGLFVNHYEPDPLDGEYPGLEGDTKKKSILDKAEDLYRRAREGGLELAGRRVTSGQKYTTGKYDVVNDWPGFPDEGIRLYFGSELDYMTIRPSGTTNSLRFHVQFYGGAQDPPGVWERRMALENEAKDLVTEVRDLIGARRQEGVEY
jgi:phosphomannomutase